LTNTLTRAAIREAEATGNIEPIREAIAEANILLATPQPAVPLWRRGLAVLRAWGGVGVAAVGIVALAVVLALASGHVIGGEGVPTPSATGASAAAGVATPPAGQAGATAWSTGRTFVNGDFRMTLLEVEQGLTQIGGSGTWTSEQGQFVVVTVEVEYTGSGTGYFPPDEQRLRVATGSEYGNDVESAFRAGSEALGQDALAAGQPTRGYLVFDILATDSPTGIEFVGDILSSPVTIPLG
jgi:hypothetical protein